MKFYDKSVELYENKKISKWKMKSQVTIKHEIGGLKKKQSPCKVLDFEKKKEILLKESNSDVWTMKCKISKS